MALLYADNRASFARSPPPTYFRLFTKESLTKIERRIRDERQARALVKQLQEQGDPAAAAAGPRDDLQPNPQLEAGRTLPARMGEFPPELYGKPIEELDEFYHNKYVSISSTALANHRLNGSSSPVLTATSLSHGETKNSTPHKIKTPGPIEIIVVTADYVGEGTRHAKFYANSFKGGFSANG